ncbi:unnamed protein product [Tilletia laevis]|uniref:Uncharacterized protein n=2 Tax=Tilletia TaxID=13289 RepID=A0A177VD74_9BASI|nr:hypothetical protein CF336_g5977 [Tilletia laevis]KAE8264218.1 hypothetical protein A4X03_0g1114 [Tilletia caries]CAD6915427.1 unnamed protein product [Tilletia controversa]CAD6887796.1 unnamed protein product [Tilletia caries]CAD6953972.1 unnamed protein product [Tilletia caries]
MPSPSGPTAPASATRPPPPPRSLKLVLIGDGGVGKTTLRSRFLTGHFAPAYRATIGADFLTKTLSLNPDDPASPRVTVSIWDTAGQERFASLGASFYRGADAVIIAFDSNASLAHIQARLTYWHNEFLTKTPIPPNEHARRFCWVCVGCKTDLIPDSDQDTALTLKRNQVQAVLDAILPRPRSDIQAEDISSEPLLPPSPIPASSSSNTLSKNDLTLKLNDTRADRRKSLPYPAAMAKRASKQSLRSTISVKPIPTPPPPNSAGSASRSRSRRISARNPPRHSNEQGSPLTSPALGLTTASSSSASTPTPFGGTRSDPIDVTPTKASRPLPLNDDDLPSAQGHTDSSSAISISSASASASAHSFPILGPSSAGSSASSTNNPLLYSGGIYVNGKMHKRDRLDSSVSNTSTIYHTPRNSTFFPSSPATHRSGLTTGSAISGSDPAVPPFVDGRRTRTSLESTRSNGSHPSVVSGLRRRASNESVSSVRTVKGDDGASSLGHGSNGTSIRFGGGAEAKERGSGSGRSSLELDTQVKRKSSLAFSYKGEDDQEDGKEESTEEDDAHEMRNLVRPRGMTRRESSSDTVQAPQRAEASEEEFSAVEVDDASISRPQSGVSTSTSMTERSWDQPTPRPGSWAQTGAGGGGDSGEGGSIILRNQAEVDDIDEEDQEDEDDEEDEYGLRRTSTAFPLEPIPFPSAAIYHEPHHFDDDLDPNFSLPGGSSNTLSRATAPPVLPSLSITDTSDDPGGAPSTLYQSKKEAAQAEMERWREARSRKRRSRMGTGATTGTWTGTGTTTRVDSLRMEAEVSSMSSSLTSAGSVSAGKADGASEPSRSRTVSNNLESEREERGRDDADGEVDEAGTTSGRGRGETGGYVVGSHDADLSSSRRSSLFRPQDDTTITNNPLTAATNVDPTLTSTSAPGPTNPPRPSSPATDLDPTDPEPAALEEGFHLFLTSCKIGTNVSNVFTHVVERVSARWAYEEWEEREYRRAVREWKVARRLEREGGVGGAQMGRKGRWMAIFGRGRGAGSGAGAGGGRNATSGAAEEWELDEDEDEEEERTRVAVRRAIRIAAGKDSGAGAWSVKGCCSG